MAQQRSMVRWQTGAYAYDGAGNIRAMGADTFTYDRVSRLVKGSLASIAWQQCASFDAFGNITGLANVATGTTCTPSPISVDAATNRLGSPSTYDEAGQMTRWGPDGLRFDYQWYPTGQMRHTDGSGRWTLYGYGADGERMVWYDDYEKVLHYTLRDLAGKVLREYAQNQLDFTWSWTKDYVYRDGLLLATIEPPLASPVVKHVHLDHLGNVRRLTDTAVTPVVVGTRNFLPFGQLYVDTAPTERLAFTAHERDLRDPVNTTDDPDDMHARYYNLNVARFLSVDPGRDYNPKVPQSWNLYGYVRNNPIAYVDPDGLAVQLTSITNIQERDLLIGELEKWSGLDLELEDGLLVSKGITKDVQGNPMGSETARNDLLKAIGSETVYYGISRNDAPGVHMGKSIGNHIYLDFKDIAKIDAGNNNPLTLGAGAIFLHELNHAFGRHDPHRGMLGRFPNLQGPTVEHMNSMRRELGLQLRLQYKYLTGKDGRQYIPFTDGPVYIPTRGVH
jgi:RHS repeat-associated protein